MIHDIIDFVRGERTVGQLPPRTQITLAIVLTIYTLAAITLIVAMVAAGLN